jgi:uncharacterized Ntn-hydrolase superfamily protein
MRFVSALRAVGAALLLVTLAPLPAHATWSVIAVDRATGRLVVASATCVAQNALRNFPAKGLMDVQAIIAPGYGVAAAQAGVDRTRANQTLIHAGLKAGVHPSEILRQLMADSLIQSRQFAMVDLQGRVAGFSGARNQAASLSVQGQVAGTEVYYAIQGNILASNEVVQGAVRTFEATGGALEDRVMAAMEAADAAGGDRRCSCSTPPVPETVAPCTHRTAHVAYLAIADASSVDGTSFNDGQYVTVLDVTDENTQRDEDANPVTTLRRRYDAWRRGR